MKNARKILLAAAILGLMVSGSEAKRYITEPLLVPQSPYAGMTF